MNFLDSFKLSLKKDIDILVDSLVTILTEPENKYRIELNFSYVHEIKLDNIPSALDRSTFILTSDGCERIDTLENKEISIRIGNDSKKTIIKKKNVDSIYSLTFSNGCRLKVSESTVFPILRQTSRSDYRRDTLLKNISDEKIIKIDFPIINSYNKILYSYTHGLFCADGSYSGGNGNDEVTQCKSYIDENEQFCRFHISDKEKFEFFNLKVNIHPNRCKGNVGPKPILDLYRQEKICLHEHIDYVNYHDRQERGNSVRRLTLPWNISPKYHVPVDCNVKTKLEWFSGYLDGDGALKKSDKSHKVSGLQLSSVEKEFIENIGYLLNTLGCTPNICLRRKAQEREINGRKANCKDVWAMNIASKDVDTLIKLGLKTYRLDLKNFEYLKDQKRYISIDSREKIQQETTVYYFDPPVDLVIANGIPVCM